MSGLVVALDTSDLGRLEALAAGLSGVAGRVKVGLEAYTAHGPTAVRAVEQAGGPPVFLDLKLHDIPATVGRSAAVAADLGVAMLTVHASGGPAMLAAAVRAAPDIDVLAVTVLTSLDDAVLAAVGQPAAAEQVDRLARLAIDGGASGCVCAPGDVARLRRALGSGPLLVVPGVRPQAGAASAVAADDQRRVGRPGDAVRDGADWLVVGRPITGAADPVGAARAVLDEMAAA